MTTLKSLKILMKQFLLHDSESALGQVKTGEIVIFEDDKITPIPEQELQSILEAWEKHIEAKKFFEEFLK